MSIVVDSVASIDRHSRMVDLLRRILPLVALFLVGLVTLWPQLSGGYNGLIVPILGNADVDASEAMRMQMPRYVGLTPDNEPYEVTASSAFLNPRSPDRIYLENLVAKLGSGERESLSLDAGNGVYHRDRNALDLRGGLSLMTGTGYRLTGKNAEIDFDNSWATSNAKIEGRGPLGNFTASGFSIADGGNMLRLEGPVKMTVLPASRDDQ